MRNEGGIRVRNFSPRSCIVALVVALSSACLPSVYHSTGGIMPVFRHPAGEGEFATGQMTVGLNATLLPETSTGQAFAGAAEVFLGTNWSAGVDFFPFGDLPSGAVFARRHFELMPWLHVAAHVGAQVVNGWYADETELDDYIYWMQNVTLVTADVGGVATVRPWSLLAASVGYGAQFGRLTGHRECSIRGVSWNDEACVADGDFEPAVYPIIHSLTGSLRLGHPRVGADWGIL